MAETEYRPDSAVPPGVTLLEILCERFEKESGIDITTIERLIQGDTPLTDSIAARLYAATGVPIHLWLNLEEDYRETLQRNYRTAKLKITICTDPTAHKKIQEEPWQETLPSTTTENTTATTSEHRADT